jgi:hypothetical protein
MADQDKKEEIKGQERKISADEQKIEFKIEAGPAPEKKESPYEKVVSDELKREIEMMELDEGKKKEAGEKAKKIEFLGEKEKLEHLLQIAREKGVVFAIQVARKMNEPYLLDILHDILAKEGYYKDFTK